MRLQGNLARFDEAERLSASRRTQGEAALRLLFEGVAATTPPPPPATAELDALAGALDLNSKLDRIVAEGHDI